MALQVVILHLHLDDGRAKDVPGVMEGDLYPPGHLHRYAVSLWVALTERLLGVGQGVQRLNRRLALACAPAVLPLGVFLLQEGRIQQHQFEQLAAGFGGMDRAAIPLGHQTRQQPAVIEVGVGNDHGIQAARIEGKSTVVLIFLLAASLVHAAFEQHPGTLAAFHEVAGACDLLNRADEGEQGHGSILVVMMRRVCLRDRKQALM